MSWTVNRVWNELFGDLGRVEQGRLLRKLGAWVSDTNWPIGIDLGFADGIFQNGGLHVVFSEYNFYEAFYMGNWSCAWLLTRTLSRKQNALFEGSGNTWPNVDHRKDIGPPLNCIGKSLSTFFASLACVPLFLIELQNRLFWILKEFYKISFLWKYEADMLNSFLVMRA